MSTAYCSKAEVLARGVTATQNEINAAINAASRSIDRYCGRTFSPPAAAATARVYVPIDHCTVAIDDAASITTLKTDDDRDGVFETTWAAGDRQLEPLNASALGLPLNMIVAIGNRRFPRVGHRALVEVTGTWGWATIPAAVRAVCIEVVARTIAAPVGIIGEQIGTYQVDYTPHSLTSAPTGVELAESEQAMLVEYRRAAWFA